MTTPSIKPQGPLPGHLKGAQNQPLRDVLARFASAAAISVLATTALSACDSASPDPLLQTIPTDSAKWQDKLGPAWAKLPEEDQQLLGRYMQRIQKSEATTTGATPSITIKDALKQQREYEQLHPDNPTGLTQTRSHADKLDKINQTYPVTLQPSQLNTSNSLQNAKLNFELVNKGSVAIKSLKGTFTLQSATFEQGKAITIPLTVFNPAIEPQQSVKLSAEASVVNEQVIKGIQNPKTVTVEITKATLLLSNGDKVVLEKAGEVKP